MSEKRHITPVILSGGSGTRLWPLSLPAKPKQLLPLTSGETMLQLTIGRTRDRASFHPPIIVASERHAEEIERQVQEAGVSVGVVILEPAARNTAPAIALAALLIDPESPMLVMPSDHVINDEAAFQEAIRKALPAAEEGWLVTFGISPDKAETGYGYIRFGPEIVPGVRRADTFVEKPDAERAAAMVADGEHAWNGGIFLFRPDAYLEALERHAPDILAAARAAIETRRQENGRIHPAAEAFAASPSVSIDYAVMEKADRVAVVPVAMQWSDLGSWDALYELGGKDGSGNVVSGDVTALHSSNCLIRSDGPAIAALGVEDLVIVTTKDAVLVMRRGETQRVREAVEALKAKGHKAAGE